MKRTRIAAICALAAAGLGLAACQREPAPPEPTASASAAHPTPAPTLAAPSQPVAPPSAAPSAPARLDRGALQERRDPRRVLRFYAAAIAAHDWNLAARAWNPQSGVTAATLKAAYDRAETPHFSFGQGQIEGAAGSLYYESPTTVRFGADGAAERGALILRRVNDVDGATAEQLRWRIESSTIGAGQ